MAGWGRKAANKAKAQHSTDIIPSKLNTDLQHSARLGKTFPVGFLMAGWGRKVENKAKAQHSTDFIPSKLIAELQHSAWLGKTFKVGWWVGVGWVGW